MSDDLQALRETEAEIVEEFAFFDDWKDRYSYIIDLARNLPPFPELQKIDENKVSGCQSQVWFVAEQRDGKLYFNATSDAAIVSGLIALLLRVYSGRLPKTIVQAEPEFIAKIDLAEHLSPTRSNGLYAMVRAIHNLAARAHENAA
ncbi:MAG: SufE family protein [Alphaproteobacteria bacterium]|nr:SufE family protein [Alphaproteobacteria bacterium]